MAATARQLGAPIDLVVYPDARHDFNWPSSGNYNKSAAEGSWRRPLAALRLYLTEPMARARITLGS
jgi:dienelactone hydrolase